MQVDAGSRPGLITSVWGMFMDRYDDVGAEENLLDSNIPDDALERAASPIGAPVWTMNYCTYNYYQCGPIGSRA